MSGGSASWADYDRDGRLDFLVTGYNGLSNQNLAQLWRNTGSGFSNVPVQGLSGVVNSSVAWADYDRDGLLDFLLTGSTGQYVSQLWRNTGNGFTNVAVPGLPGVDSGSVAWGDCDNDGLPDFLLSGNTGSSGLVSQLWKNTGSGFTNVPISGLPGVNASAVAWADYDRDGRMDFLITGYNSNYVAQLWRNAGSGFTNVPIAGLRGVYEGSVAWADFDNDGASDFLLTGYAGNFVIISELWRNTGSGFTNVPLPGVPGIYDGSTAWADYDNDGLADFLLTGSTNVTPSGPVSQLWRNTGNGFTNVPISGLPQAYRSSVAWGDFDNDGRSDFLFTGLGQSSRLAQILRNTSLTTNNPPTAPTQAKESISNGWTVLSWEAAVDPQTASNGLGYNLRVGTLPGSENVVSPQGLASGFRLLPTMGNAAMNTNALLSLNPGTYYWSVQAIDTSYAGGPFTAEQSFLVPGPRLSITPFNNYAIISWLPDYAGFVLQESTDLSSASWTNSSSGNSNPVILPATPTSKYYRLVLQNEQ